VKLAAYKTINIKPAIKKYQIIRVHFAFCSIVTMIIFIRFNHINSKKSNDCAIFENRISQGNDPIAFQPMEQ
jgi:hypothetical protein